MIGWQLCCHAEKFLLITMELAWIVVNNLDPWLLKKHKNTYL